MSHSIAATKALVQEIRDALEETEVGEDVWSTINVNEPNNSLSSVNFTIEGADDRFYEVHLIPVEAPGADDDDEGE